MAQVDTINISIIYAHDDGRHFIKEMTVSVGTTIYQALLQSGLLEMGELLVFKNWCEQNQDNDPNHKAWHVGIYSAKKRFNTPLAEGDRIEIYRPLGLDPMAKRKTKSKATIKKLIN